MSAVIRYNDKELLSGSWFFKDEQSCRNGLLMDEFALKTGGFDQRNFYLAFQEFDNQSIEKSLQSEDLIVRIFAILDKRVGKRRLIALKNGIKDEPEMFRLFYAIRLEAEGLA